MSDMTGFFGIPGRVVRHGLSHSVHWVRDGKPVCGTRIHPKAEFQFCAHGLYYEFLECEKCIEIVDKMKRRDLKWFDSLQRRDFDNQAVINEIREVFKERDVLYAELNTEGPKESRRARRARTQDGMSNW